MIASPPIVRPGSALVVHGTFSLARAPFEHIEAPLQRAIVCVARNGMGVTVSCPFLDPLLFADDEVPSAERRRGHFGFDALAGRPTLEGRWFVYVAIGTSLSNVVEVSVRNPLISEAGA